MSKHLIEYNSTKHKEQDSIEFHGYLEFFLRNQPIELPSTALVLGIHKNEGKNYEILRRRSNLLFSVVLISSSISHKYG